MFNAKKSIQSEGAFRVFANGHFGPTQSGEFVTPAGKGLQITAFTLQKDHYLSLPFQVTAANEMPDWWKMVKELDNTTKSRLRAAISTSADGSGTGAILRDIGPSGTVTDQPFGNYTNTKSVHHGGCIQLQPGTYYLLIEDLDNVNVEIPLGHQNGN